MLVLLYCLSQTNDFSESLKPLMEKLKNSEQMLCFLKDLSRFSQTFSTFRSETGKQSNCEEKQPKPPNPEKKEEPQSPTAGIADEFIQSILNNYLKQS